MIGIEWLRRKTAQAASGTDSPRRPSDADVQRVAPLVEAALERRELEATGAALTPPDTLWVTAGRVVSCPCHVIYSRCRCP